MKPLALIAAVCLACSAYAEVIRCASFDGNQHDTDDVGAVAVMMALAEGDPAFVHLHFNSHFPSSTQWQATAMRASVYGARDRFGHSGVSIYDHSPGNLASLINSLNENRTMRYYLGGPAETLWRGLSASNRAKHKYITVKSHSGWNNTHEHSGTHTLDDCRRRFTFRYEKIGDQNAKLRGPYSDWFWARDSQHESMRFLYSRIVASKKQLADVSDAGMYFHDVCGYSPSVADIRRKIDPDMK
jgi:hypothetical protein